ncbi:hypothetical protein MNBD_GAMMA01-2009 [hydrothermal vent metagenome]|uniref:Uncharacterized protein n=1 Tax=hydrothermal vent metagenome TaxID=652676 RepID=A0A3B0VCB7_9ZZZZ
MKIKAKLTNKTIRFYTFIGIFAYSCTLQAGPIEDLQPGHWVEIPDTNLSQVYPSPTPWGKKGPTAIMSAWSGGAYDTQRNRLIVWGGGHVNYAGNEMYAFDIDQLSWFRITEPSPGPTPCELYMFDGQPGSHHTYNMLQYTILTDSLISVSGGGYGSGCDAEFSAIKSITTDKFNFTTNTWTKGSEQPSAGDTIGRVSATDPATGHIWMHGTYGGSKLLEYNPANDEWHIRSNGEYLEIEGAAAIDPVRRLMVVIGRWNSSSGTPRRQIKVWDLTQSLGSSYTPETSGDNTLEFLAGNGFVFDPTINKFVGWNNGSEVYTLDPETWIWEKIDAAPTNTTIPSAEPNGTFGRFRYIPSKNVYIVVNRTTENVYFYRLNNN